MRTEPPTLEEMTEKLNYLYFHNAKEYLEHKKMIKQLGYKVYRNSAGKHKVEIDMNYLNNAFGGVFKDILGK